MSTLAHYDQLRADIVGNCWTFWSFQLQPFESLGVFELNRAWEFFNRIGSQRSVGYESRYQKAALRISSESEALENVRDACCYGI